MLKTNHRIMKNTERNILTSCSTLTNAVNRLSRAMLRRNISSVNVMRKASVWRAIWLKPHQGAMRSLGDCYANGIGVRKNEWQAATWYAKAAEPKQQQDRLASHRFRQSKITFSTI